MIWWSLGAAGGALEESWSKQGAVMRRRAGRHGLGESDLMTSEKDTGA